MKPERDAPCPCGSGKKYEKCCYLTEQFTAIEKFIKSKGSVKQGPLGDDVQNGYNDLDMQKMIIAGINNMRNIFMNDKPHIKEYYKIRKMHGKIVNAMIQYDDAGKFKRQIDTSIVQETKPENIHLLETHFDFQTDEGNQAYYDMMIYKTVLNMSCITEDFINNHRYKKPDETEFLHSMLNSKLGLFEIIGTDMKEGYAYIKDVFTGDEYTIIDIALSGQERQVYDTYYLYTRIITYRDISFGSGLNLVFDKKDRFIKHHIWEHKKDFKSRGEFLRFVQLYNHYSKHNNKIKMITNEL